MKPRCLRSSTLLGRSLASVAARMSRTESLRNLSRTDTYAASNASDFVFSTSYFYFYVSLRDYGVSCCATAGLRLCAVSSKALR